MPNYTKLTSKELSLKWAEIIGRTVPPIGRSLIIKYLLWYEQAKRGKISTLGFFYEIKQAEKDSSYQNKATLELGSKIIRSYQGIKYEVEIVPLKPEELKQNMTYKEPYHIGVIDNGAKVIIGQINKEEIHKNKQLINLVLKAYKWHKRLLEGDNLKNISREEQLSTRYILRVLQISFINPNIIQEILNGKQAKDLTLKKLKTLARTNFKEQKI